MGRIIRAQPRLWQPTALSISGTPAVGNTLTVSGSGLPQWVWEDPANGNAATDIAGATSSTYVIDGRYGSRRLRCRDRSSGALAPWTIAVDPVTRWTKDFEVGSDGDSLDPNQAPNHTVFDDVNEDGAPNAYSRISTTRAKFGTRSMLQFSDGSGTGVGSRVYDWTDITGQGLPDTSKQYWLSCWVYFAVAPELSVGAGDWLNLAQFQSHRQTAPKTLDPIWMIAATPGLTGNFRLRLTFWPQHHFDDNPLPNLANCPYSTGGPSPSGLDYDSGVNVPLNQWNFLEFALKPNTWNSSTSANYDGWVGIYLNGDPLPNCVRTDCVTVHYPSGTWGAGQTGGLYVGKEAYGQTIATGVTHWVDQLTLSYGRQPHYSLQ